LINHTTPGLKKRAGISHIDKRIGGRRICQSCETSELTEAERFLAQLIEQTRQAQVYGIRPSRTFEQAAVKFVLENQHKRSIDDDIGLLKLLIPWIGQEPEPAPPGIVRALDRASPQGRRGGWHHQSRFEGGAADTEPRSVRVDR
jgi:hypothetical protein